MYSIKYSDYFVMLRNKQYYLFGVGTSGKLKVLLTEKKMLAHFLSFPPEKTTTESIILCIFSVCSPEDKFKKNNTTVSMYKAEVINCSGPGKDTQV